MNARGLLIALLACILSVNVASAQRPVRKTGPLIRAAGDVYDVPEPDFQTPLDMTYRVAFEISTAAGNASQINPGLSTVARFLNMQVRAGIALQRIRVAVVMHGEAGKDLLDNAAYRERTGADNPNSALLQELMGAGVQVVLCGQTAAARDLPRDRLAEHVQVALSAMTALAVLQDQGYHVNPF